jgi:hypothetical protein
MKKLFIIALFLVMLIVPAVTAFSADNSCESEKVWRVCGAVVLGEFLYTPSEGCASVNHIGWFCRDFESANDIVIRHNNSAFASCEAERKEEKRKKEIDSVIWVEVK